MKAIVAFVDPGAFGLSAKTDVKAAHEIWRRMNFHPICDKDAARIGAGMHYAFAIAAGSMYPALSACQPWLRVGKGAMFGGLLWLLGDELAVATAGLEDPFRTRARSHLSALVAHVVYGVVVDTSVPKAS